MDDLIAMFLALARLAGERVSLSWVYYTLEWTIRPSRGEMAANEILYRQFHPHHHEHWAESGVCSERPAAI